MTHTPSHSPEGPVRPSTTLIDILHRRLLDPDIVPAFERRRRGDHVGGLDRPRWALIPPPHPPRRRETTICVDAPPPQPPLGGGVVVDDAVVGTDDATTSDIRHRAAGGVPSYARTNVENVPGGNGRAVGGVYNAVPRRNYIHLRMEQNEMFADDRGRECRRILSTLTRSGGTDSCDNNDGKWQKHADRLQSMVCEGLAACPNHATLLEVESEYKRWLRRRMDSLVGGGGGTCRSANVTAATAIATFGPPDTMQVTMDASVGCDVPPRPPESASRSAYDNRKREGRAQAAMRDALAERSFLLQGGGGNAAVVVVGENRREGKSGEDGVKYPLLPPPAAEYELIDGGHYDQKERRNEGGKTKDNEEHRMSGGKRKRGSRGGNDVPRRNRRNGRGRDERRRSRSSDSSSGGRSRRSRSISTSSSSSSRSLSASSSSISRSRSRRKRHRRGEKRKKRGSGSKKKKSKRHRSRRRRRRRGSRDGDGYRG